MRSGKIIIQALIILLCYSANAFPWTCATHIFIAREAGIKNPETACFPDYSRGENSSLMGPYHWHNAAPNTVVTPDYIDQYQIIEGMYARVGHPESAHIKIKVPDRSGVLYWKILELYQELKKTSGVEYDYYLSNIAHYVGDLSQPLHNFPYGSEPASDGKQYADIGLWAKKSHMDFDAALDAYLPLDEKNRQIFYNMVTSLQIKITSTEELKQEIAKLANSSINLANKCYADRRIITKDEALRQIAMSVSLLRAIIDSTNKF